MLTLADIYNTLNPYQWIIRIRNKAFDKGFIKSHTFDLPVICIGNITVGGTGKTPHTEYMIRLLGSRYKVAVLSRGYGRKSKGFVLGDDRATMEKIGDEPFQIKEKFRNVTVAVDEKRVHGILTLLEKDRPQVILLDDAYQHRYVKAGLNILLVDFNRPIWKDSVLPFGRLRETAKGVERADIIVVTKCPRDIDKESIEQFKHQLKNSKNAPVFFSTMQYGEIYAIFPENRKRAELKRGTNVLLVTGIAKPAPLKAELESRGVKVTLMQYSDHHNFTDKEIKEIAETFERCNGEKLIITTEKDATRLQAHKGMPQSIKENIYAIPIEVDILENKKEMFNQKILDYVTENSRNS